MAYEEAVMNYLVSMALETEASPTSVAQLAVTDGGFSNQPHVALPRLHWSAETFERF